MPTAFQTARRRQGVRKFNDRLNNKFEASQTTHIAAGVGAGAVYIDGRVYQSNSAVGATEVVNIGRPAAALYAPTTAGGVVGALGSSGGGGGGGTGDPGGSTDLTPVYAAPILMLAADANYTNERIFTPSPADFLVVDNGAGAPYDMAIKATDDAVVNPGVVLRANASAALRLATLTATTKVIAPIIESAADLRLTAATSVWINRPLALGPTIFTPEHHLHIFQAGATVGAEIESGNASDAYLRVGRSPSTGLEIRYSAADALVKFNVGAAASNYATPALVINRANGRVGIGAATAPTTTLQVTGTASATVSVATPLLTTLSGDLQIAPAGAGAVKFPNATTLVSTVFDKSVVNILGWQMAEGSNGQSVFTVGKIEADELRVDIFVANETRVDRGTQLWSKSYGLTTQAFVTPAIGSAVRFRFEDSPALNAAIFSPSDWLLFRVIDIGTGITVAKVWGQVSGYQDSDPTFPREQSWLFTMRDGPVGMSIPSGSLAVDLGQSGQALLELSTVDPAGAPYLKLSRWAGANPFTATNFTTHVLIGALSSISTEYYTPVGYGIYVRPGNDPARFLVADNQAFQIRGVDLRMFRGANQTVDLSSVDGSLKLGTNVASPATTTFSFDGTTGNVAIKGSLEAASGEVLINSDGVAVKSFAGSSVNDLNAYRFIENNITYGGMFGHHSTALRAVTIVGEGNGATKSGVIVATAWGNASESSSYSSSLVLWAREGDPNQTKIVLETNGSITLDAGTNVILNSTNEVQLWSNTKFLFDAYPNDDLGSDLGKVDKRWGILYVGQIIADTISGASMSGASWQHPGSMVIDANSASNTTVSVVNNGLGSVTFNVVGTMTVNGTPVSLLGHNHDGLYPSVATYNAHVSSANAHHAQTHVLATTTGLAGTDHSVSGLTVGLVLRATSATNAAFTQLQHSELGGLITGDPHTQYLLKAGGTVTGNVAAANGVTFDGVDLDQHVANADAHHARAHVLATATGLGADHSVSGLSVGHVLRATGATTATFSQLSHAELSNLTIGDPHTQYLLKAGGTMLGPLLVAAGTLTAPGLAFAGDAKSGLYRSAVGVWHLTAADTSIVSISLNGIQVTGAISAGGALGLDSALFAHHAHDNATNFALQQTVAGRTILNAPTAQAVDLAINNVVQWSFTVDRAVPRGNGIIDIGDSNRQVRTLYANELAVQILTAQKVISTVGGDLIVAPTTKLIADIASTAGSIGQSTLYTSLISYWKFEESTLPYYDAKGNSQIGSGNNLANGVGKINTSVTFNGAQTISTADTTALRVGDFRFYWAGWIFIGNDTGTPRYIAFGGLSPAGQRAWAIYLTGAVGAMRVRFQVWNSSMSSDATVTSVSNLAANAWHFVEVWHDSSGNQIGVAVNRTESTTSWSNGVNPNVGKVWFGSDGVGNFFTGSLDEWGFWKNSIPSTAERNFLYNSGAGRGYYDIYSYLATNITVDVEHNNLRIGEFVLLRTAPGGIQQTEKMRVATGPTTITNGYRYTMARDQDATGPNAWLTGDAVVSQQKNVGEGFLWLTANSSAYGHTGPTMIGYVRKDLTVNGIAPVFAKGNLRNFVDYSTDEYGDAVGNDLTLSPTGGFKGWTLDRIKGFRLFNGNIYIYDGPIRRFEIDGATGINLLADSSAISQPQIIAWHTNLDNKAWPPAAYMLTYVLAGTHGLLKVNPPINTRGTFTVECFAVSIVLDSDPTNLAGQRYVGSLNAPDGWSVTGDFWLANYNLQAVGNLRFGMYARGDATRAGGNWTTAGWLKTITFPGQAHAIVWEKGAGEWARGIGAASNGNFYIGRSEDNNANALAIYDVIIDTAGNFGIRTSPTATLDVARGTSNSGTAVFRGSAHASHFNFSTPEHTYIRGGLIGSFVFINDSHAGNVYVANGGGNVGIGWFEASFRLDINGACHASSFPVSSDARFKAVVAPLTNMLDKVCALDSYQFYWRPEYAGYDQFLDGDGQPILQIGFLAQEVAPLFPEVIAHWRHPNHDGTVIEDAYSVDYARLVPPLAQAMRELRQEKDAEIAALRLELARLAERLSVLTG